VVVPRHSAEQGGRVLALLLYWEPSVPLYRPRGRSQRRRRRRELANYCHPAALHFFFFQILYTIQLLIKRKEKKI
jgi:hypothetical protein